MKSVHEIILEGRDYEDICRLMKTQPEKFEVSLFSLKTNSIRTSIRKAKLGHYEYARMG